MSATLLQDTRDTSELLANETSRESCVLNPLVDDANWTGIWRISWQLMANMISLAVSNLVEGWIAGRLGADSQAAVGIGSQIWFFIMMLTLALTAGTTAVVSRYWGAGDRQSATDAGRQALLCSVLFSLASAAIGLCTCRGLLHMLGASQSLTRLAYGYLQYCIAAMVPYTVLWISNSIFRASGDSRTPLITIAICTVVTIALELMLCLGPARLGIGGIGLAWLIASSVGVAINMFKMRRSDLASCCDLGACWRDGLSLRWMKKFMTIGLPACVQDLSLLASSCGLFFFLSKTSDGLVNQAAWAAGWRIEETLVLMPMYGLNMAAATIVGQNLGAGKPRRAMVCAWQITALGAGLNFLVAVALYCASPIIASTMCDNPLVASACIDYLRTLWWTEPFLATWLILSGAMQGAAYTRIPMIVTVLCFNAVRMMPLFLCANHASAQSAWNSMAMSTALSGLLMMTLWQRGHWQKQQV